MARLCQHADLSQPEFDRAIKQRPKCSRPLESYATESIRHTHDEVLKAWTGQEWQRDSLRVLQCCREELRERGLL